MATIEEAGTMLTAPSPATQEGWIYLTGVPKKIVFANIFLGFQIDPTIRGFMRKHLSSRAKMIWLSFSFSLDIQPKKRIYQKNVANGSFTSLRSRANREPHAVGVFLFWFVFFAKIFAVYSV